MTEVSVVIIGGGASGVLAAAHLQRRNPLRGIALIERGAGNGRGLAYGTRCAAHLLNVRAARMSAFANVEGHFVSWLKNKGRESSPESFAQRSWYGEYLSDVVAQTGASPSKVQMVQGTAVGVDRDDADGGWIVQLEDGRRIKSQFVILALGNPPPANPAGLHQMAPKTYWQDPWAEGAVQGVPPDAPVLIIGTGLTMLDLTLALRAEGHRGIVHAISRRGLRSHSHCQHDAITLAPPPGASPRALMRWLRGEARTVEQNGGNWRSVMDAMRPHTRLVWQAWTIAQRRSFLRHARPYWEVHRHRCAPVIGMEIESLIARKTLIIHRGRLQAIRQLSEGAEVEWLDPRQGLTRIQVVRVINCTGPASNYAKVDFPPIGQMRRAGWLTPDALSLGIETDTEGRLIGVDGRPVPGLFALGSLRRPSWWESIAIPEIREQAEALAMLIQ